MDAAPDNPTPDSSLAASSDFAWLYAVNPIAVLTEAANVELSGLTPQPWERRGC